MYFLCEKEAKTEFIIKIDVLFDEAEFNCRYYIQ